MPPKSKKPAFQYGSFKDAAGNSYRTIEISGKSINVKQEWFADNLITDAFRNGDKIPQAQSREEWKKYCDENKPAWCYHEQNQSTGKLYNLAAILDSRGLTPEGFIIPDYIDFTILAFSVQEYEPVNSGIESLNNNRTESSGIACGALKMMGKEFWKKKGKDVCGLDINGGGCRTGAYTEFHEIENAVQLWLYPKSAPITVKGGKLKNGNTAHQVSIEINHLKEVLPEIKLTQQDFDQANLKNISLEISPDEWESLFRIIKDQASFIQKYYPVKKNNEKDFSFDIAIGHLMGEYNSNNRVGTRNAVFANNKDKIWFTLVDKYAGAYVRPFRYL
jgi:uncharacterized protein (TIGR02145 family)